MEENTSIERNTNVRRKTSTNQYLQLESKPKSRYFLKPNSYINISENNLNLVIHVNEDMDVRLLHFSCAEYNPKQIKKDSEKWFRLVEIQASGENHNDHHGSKHTGTNPGQKLKYQQHIEYRNNFGKKLEIIMENEGLNVIAHWQFYDSIAVIRAWIEVVNNSEHAVPIEYVSSFVLAGIEKESNLPWGKNCKIHIPYNSWCSELRWKSLFLDDCGLPKVNPFSTSRVLCSSMGGWSSHEYLPAGVFENVENNIALFWQIEHNGSWNWEIGDISGHLYLHISGPNESKSHWFKNLEPGQTFLTVPVAVGSCKGNTELCWQALTRYRRKIRRQYKNDKNLPVIFNDYLNCLFGDPTSEKLMPLIDTAAELGCEYYCIDAGWYDDGYWWDGVGQWMPSDKRFPNGLEEVVEYIKSKGMIPGIWLEIEVMGIKCSVANIVSSKWFFIRHGERIIDHSRYQLDFRNPEVVDYVNKIIDRVVDKYGFGYIKFDYNINSGVGTEVNADSFGDGLLEHNRAYLKWLDSVIEKYPHLVIENCASGGMRMDYATLSRYDIQSLTDQTDFRQIAAISTAAPTAVIPEQAGIWSGPQSGACEEDIIFNMINCMLSRIHQSGAVLNLPDKSLNLIKEGIICYKKIRGRIPQSIPFWPLGLPTEESKWLCLGLLSSNKAYLAVWRLKSEKDFCSIPLREFSNNKPKVSCIYPLKNNCQYKISSKNLIVKLPRNYSARLFQVDL